MYLPDCYWMRFTTLSNYYLIDWWCNFDFCLFACWIDFRFCYSYMTWETTGLELALTINLVLQANRLTKCASHPNLITKILFVVQKFNDFVSSLDPKYVINEMIRAFWFSGPRFFRSCWMYDKRNSPKNFKDFFSLL